MKNKDFYEDENYTSFMRGIEKESFCISYHFYTKEWSNRGYVCVFYDLKEQRLKDITFEGRYSILLRYDEKQRQDILNSFKKEVKSKIEKFERNIEGLKRFKKTEGSIKKMQEDIEELNFVLSKLKK